MPVSGSSSASPSVTVGTEAIEPVGEMVVVVVNVAVGVTVEVGAVVVTTVVGVTVAVAVGVVVTVTGQLQSVSEVHAALRQVLLVPSHVSPDMHSESDVHTWLHATTLLIVKSLVLFKLILVPVRTTVLEIFSPLTAVLLTFTLNANAIFCPAATVFPIHVTFL